MCLETEEVVKKQLGDLGYCVEKVLGKGNFSTVYKVWKDEGEEKQSFACKVSSEKGLLCQEAMFLKQFMHPLLPAYKEYEETEDAGFLFQELVVGKNLAEAGKDRGGFSAFQTVQIALSLAEGLKYLHDGQPPVLYLDIKPENVMICQDGSVRLLDFGCCCYLDKQNKGCKGTPGFAAPEQLQWEEKAGKYSDIYGLGQLMKWMLRKSSGLKLQDEHGKKQENYRNESEQWEKVHRKRNAKEKYQKRYKRKHKRKQHEYEKRVQKIIAQATKDVPEKRLQDMQEVIDALQGKKKRKRKCVTVRNVWERNNG